MSALARQLVGRGRPADFVAVGALLVYAVAVAAALARPLLVHPRVVPVPTVTPASVPARSQPEEAEQLALAPADREREAERHRAVQREWTIIGGVGVNVVTVDPSAEHLRVELGLAHGTVLSAGQFGREGFGEMVRRLRPLVAINGTYFHLQNNEPVGALVMDGRLVYDGLAGSCLAIREDGKVEIAYRAAGTMGRNAHWPAGVATALGGGPILVRNGSVSLHPYDEGFGDPSLFAEASRSAAGVTSDGKLLLVTVETPITLNKLANIMLRLNAVEALNLDGGGSSALYDNGQFVTIPRRPLTNLLLVYD